MKKVAWYGKGFTGSPRPVGFKRDVNPWGLQDMHGNVGEWCRDWYAPYDPQQTSDPLGPAEGTSRVLRGGSYWNDASGCRSAYRWDWRPGDRDDIIGFRVAFPAAPSLKFDH